METSQNGLSRDSNWESQLKEVAQMPGASSRPLQDEIISVYEVFVKDDALDQEGSINSNGKPEVSVISALPTGTSQHQLIQGDCALDLDAIDVISADGDVEDEDDDGDGDGDSATMAADAETAEAVNGLLEKESGDLEASQSTENTSEKNMVLYSHPVERPSSTTARLIDKDDPRSRLHYVKYLKRDGKTLKIWECGICSKEFRHQYTLMRHLPTHTDERNFKCDACGKAFRQLSTLSQHKAIHSDARPYVCEFCKKTFNRVSTLISHRKTHSEHKPHKCHLCGKGFHQKGNLRNHVFTHTNERPYKCEICNKGFNQMSNLVCHKVKAHAHVEKMQYSCGLCSKEFPRRSSLRSHEEYKHGIKYRQSANSQNATNESKSSKSKSVRVVHVSEDEQPSSFSDLRDKDMNMTEFMENIIIDKIETKAMETALLQGQTPFALFKPAKGIPVLVKVTASGDFNHLLTPATAEDLKMSGKMDSSSTQLSDVDGSKSVQIKVPVVATVTEKIESDGKISFTIEPPGPDQDQVYLLQNLWGNVKGSRLHRAFIHIFPFPLLTDSLLTPVNPEILPFEDNDYSSPEQQQQQQQQEQQLLSEPVIATSDASNHTATDDELLELAAIGGIQFVRATEDGRYEVMTNSEARDLMAQNSHDVKILGAEETEDINNVINVHGDLDYLPAATAATVIAPEDLQHQTPEIIQPDSDGIMVLDPNNDQKALTLGDIEILEDKELRQLLDSKYLEGRCNTNPLGATYLSQAKVDEILNSKPISIPAGITIMDENDYPKDSNNCINSTTCHNGLQNNFNHRNELPVVTTSSMFNMNSQQHQQIYQQQQYPFPILQEPIPFLKNSQSFNDELNAIFGEESPAVIDYSTLPEYNPRLKLSEFEDDPESIFLNLGQSNPKVITQKNQGMLDIISEKPHETEKIIERTIENTVKLIEDKNSSSDLISPYEDYRFPNTYDQFFKNTMYDSHFGNFNPLTAPLSSFIPDIDGMKKDMQILEKTLESKFFSANFENKENDRQIYNQIPAEGSFGNNGSAISSVLANVESFFEKEPDRAKMDAGNFLQACSPCVPPDLLYLENRLPDRELVNTPSRTLEKSQPEREIPTGLPDLDCWKQHC